jgi:hypothetical protein
MLPHVGGNWNNGAHAGSFAVNLINDSGNTTDVAQSPTDFGIFHSREMGI